MALNTFTFHLLLAIITLLGIGIVFLIVYIINKRHTISILKDSMRELEESINALDEQAKLIIQSDMELKLYQEEVEDKLNKLTFLKGLVYSSSLTLDQGELFKQINEKVINDLGFSRGVIVDFETLDTKVNIGFEKGSIDIITDFMAHKKNNLMAHPLLTTTSQLCKKLASDLKTPNILVGSLRARDHIHAAFILSNPLLSTPIRKEEITVFSIICMYLGQCLNNIKLFEDLYHTKEDLEKKVRERTDELVKSLRKTEVISKQKSDFISSVSHELRTPLTSVKGFSSLLADEKFGQLPEQAKKKLQTIDENVDKLVGIVNVLLDISRIESGKTEVKIAPADIVRLIKDVSEFLSPQMKEKEINCILDLPKKLIVFMDKNLIERVLLNLIGNSIKFTQPHGSITIKCHQNEKQLTVSIADTGIGIEKEDLEKVFQEFYRSKTTHTAPGSGLGLSLVKRIIDTHKERIWVESEKNKGTIIYFTLKAA